MNKDQIRAEALRIIQELGAAKVAFTTQEEQEAFQIGAEHGIDVIVELILKDSQEAA